MPVSYFNAISIPGSQAGVDANVIATGDFNGDGFTDILVTAREHQIGAPVIPLDPVPVSILLGDGAGNYIDGTSAVFIGLATRTTDAMDILVADFNSDGRDDIFIAEYGNGTINSAGAQNRLILSSGSDKMIDATANLPALVDATESASYADIDGDGDLDILVGNIRYDAAAPAPYHTPYFLINNGVGGFTRADDRMPTAFSDTTSAPYRSSAFADLDNDGDQDLIWGSTAGRTIIAVNDGTGHFVTTLALPIAPPPIGQDPGSVRGIGIFDLNSDGFKDIIVSSHNGARTQILMGGAGLTFTDQTATRIDDTAEPPYSEVTYTPFDINNDGLVDLVRTSYSGSAYVDFLVNVGGSLLVLKYSGILTDGKLSGPFDADGDGLVDFFRHSGSTNTAYSRFEFTGLGVSQTGTANLDHMMGDNDAETLVGLALADKIFGAGGDDIIDGGDDNDYLLGGLGADQIDGGAGADKINGGAGDDTLNGGDGDDTLEGGGGADDFDGGAGFDLAIIDLSARTNALTFALGDASIMENGSPISSITGVERISITGGSVGDTLTGGALNDTINGSGGNDTLAGLAGADTINGGDGTDTLNGGADNDTLDGGAGADAMEGGDGNDTFVVDNAGDTITDSSGTDTVRSKLASYTLQTGIENLIVDALGAATLIGNASNNNITGGQANDVIVGMGGTDTLSGQGGDDTLIGGQGGGGVLSGGDGADVIWFYGNANVNGGAGFDHAIQLDGTGQNKNIGAQGIEVYISNSGADTISATGATSSIIIYGGSGNDILTQGAGGGYLFGQDGNDTLSGGAGQDIILGGAGADNINGLSGNDVLYIDAADGQNFSGGDGIDYAIVDSAAGVNVDLGTRGIEVFIGNAGNDTINASGVSEPMGIYGFSGDDLILGGSGASQLFGQDGNDVLVGGSSNDVILGGAGLDQIYGAAGADVLLGEAGNDLIVGGLGGDVLWGGAGSDTFRFSISELTAGVQDIIADFGDVAGNDDVIELVGITSSQVSITNVAGGAQITVSTAGAGYTLLLSGISAATVQDDLLFT